VHEKLVLLVESMVAFYKHLAAARSVAQKALAERQIEVTDAEIDRLVYEVYCLTPEEISLVEEATSRAA